MFSKSDRKKSTWNAYGSGYWSSRSYSPIRSNNRSGSTLQWENKGSVHFFQIRTKHNSNSWIRTAVKNTNIYRLTFCRPTFHYKQHLAFHDSTYYASCSLCYKDLSINLWYNFFLYKSSLRSIRRVQLIVKVYWTFRNLLNI